MDGRGGLPTWGPPRGAFGRRSVAEWRRARGTAGRMRVGALIQQAPQLLVGELERIRLVRRRRDAFRNAVILEARLEDPLRVRSVAHLPFITGAVLELAIAHCGAGTERCRKSTRLNSS